MRWGLRSVLRLPLWLQIGGVLIVAVLFARVVNFVIISHVIRSGIESTYAERLRAEADLLHTLLDSPSFAQGQHQWWSKHFSAPDSGYLWQVERGAATVQRSPLLGRAVLPDLGRVPGVFVKVVTLSQGKVMLLEDRRLLAAGAAPVVVKLAIDYDEIDATDSAITNERVLVYILSLLLVVPAMALVLWWPVRIVKHMARDLKRVTSGELKTLSGDYPADLMQLVEALNQLLEMARKTREITELQAMASAHNIRSSLSRISLQAAELVASNPGLHRDIAQNIEDINRHLGQHLHQMQMVRSVTMVVKPEIDNLDLFVERVFAAVQRLHGARGLVWRLGTGPNVAVALESRELGEIIFNLLDNAGKWASKTVECNWRIADGWLVVEVQDDGPGVQPTDASLPEDTPAQGLGLGLQIVKDLARLRGGEISYCRGKLAGACFCLRLPLTAHGIHRS